ncbi:AraC family transcriptional regulator [Paenibacillus sp.]|uniref:AraC family transcriptional regulator n=1 Tax=Paenibacillus sp. TaxID=58172 RepID=UPI0028128403|nr:AraC family transcriptional regulator [Paenibacillus sp.]
MTNPYQLKQLVPHLDPAFPFNVFDIVPPEKQIMHLHWHDDWEIVYFRQGNAVFHIGSERVRPQPGDLLFVNRGLIHTGFAEDDGKVRYAAVVFHPSLVAGSLADAYHLQIIGPFASGKSFFPIHIGAEHPQHPSAVALVEDLIAEYGAKAKGYELAIRSKLHLLLIHLLRHHDVSGGRTRVHGFDEELYGRFKELIAYIENRYADKLTVQLAASIVNLSEYHFCRTFKKITGKTFVEYVNLHRINAAERLLVDTTTPVTEIAYRVGFSSINYFSQMFKHYKRCSPSQCRKRQGAHGE